MNLALQVTGLALCWCVRTHQDWVHSHVDPANADHQTPAERQAKAQWERVLWRKREMILNTQQLETEVIC